MIDWSDAFKMWIAYVGGMMSVMLYISLWGFMESIVLQKGLLSIVSLLVAFLLCAYIVTNIYHDFKNWGMFTHFKTEEKKAERSVVNKCVFYVKEKNNNKRRRVTIISRR